MAPGEARPGGQHDERRRLSPADDVRCKARITSRLPKCEFVVFDPIYKAGTAETAPLTADNLSLSVQPGGRDSARSVSEDGTRPTGSKAGKRYQRGAVSTTCPLEMTGPQSWQFLGAGIDTLDVGIGVDWSEASDGIFADLERGKSLAQGTGGIPFRSDEQCLILPSGKPPTYSFHLQFPHYHLYLNRSQCPQGLSPNVYLCLNSEPLWTHWIPGALQEPVDFIERCGGETIGEKPSRVDLCADFLIPGGLNLAFLEAHRCPQKLKQRAESDHGSLETYYVGARGSAVQCRIYDKGKEIFSNGCQKLWFRDIWGVESVENVWRIEFQLRRPILKKFEIHSISDLTENLPGLWRYLTEDWITFRMRDKDSNVTRCEMQPWWQDVINAHRTFGEFKPLQRSEQTPTASIEWYISQISGCLASYAVRRALPDLELALKGCFADVRQYWSSKSWQESYFTKSIKLGLDPGTILHKELSCEIPDFQIRWQHPLSGE